MKEKQQRPFAWLGGNAYETLACGEEYRKKVDSDKIPVDLVQVFQRANKILLAEILGFSGVRIM